MAEPAAIGQDAREEPLPLLYPDDQLRCERALRRAGNFLRLLEQIELPEEEKSI